METVTCIRHNTSRRAPRRARTCAPAGTHHEGVGGHADSGGDVRHVSLVAGTHRARHEHGNVAQRSHGGGDGHSRRAAQLRLDDAAGQVGAQEEEHQACGEAVDQE